MARTKSCLPGNAGLADRQITSTSAKLYLHIYSFAVFYMAHAVSGVQCYRTPYFPAQCSLDADLRARCIEDIDRACAAGGCKPTLSER